MLTVRRLCSLLLIPFAFACRRSPTEVAPEQAPSATRSASNSVGVAPHLPNTAPSSVTPSDAGAPIAPITAATAALVWQPGTGNFKTVWVEPSATGVQVKRSRSEPVVATRTDLYALRITKGSESSLDAVPIISTGPINVVSATVEDCNHAMGDATVLLRGAVGSVVFYSAHGLEMGCEAAHPTWHDQAGALNIESRAKLSFDPFPGLPRLVAIAQSKFQREVDAGTACLMDSSETPYFYTADFAYDGRGVLRGHYTFTMQAPYVCGTGPGHYSTTQEVFDSSLPPSVEFWKQTPGWLSPYLAKHPSVGVSPLPLELDAVAAAVAFERAPMPRVP